MRPVSIRHLVASRHQPLDSWWKPGECHKGSSRTTMGCHRHAHHRREMLFAQPSIAGSPAHAVVTLCFHHCGWGGHPLGGWFEAARHPLGALCLWQEGKTNLSHDGLNPAHVPCWWVNNPNIPTNSTRLRLGSKEEPKSKDQKATSL